MNHLPFIALCAAALTVGLAGAARADDFQIVQLAYTTGLTQHGSVTETEAADGTFVDDFLFFNSPSYSLDTYLGSTTGGITFQSVVLFPFKDPADTVVLNGSVGSAAFALSPQDVLPSAAWELQVTGNASLGSSYTLDITSTATDAPPLPAVAEPANVAMLIAGLGLLASQALCRKSRANDVANA